MRDYLSDLEAKALLLLTDVGGSASGIASDGTSFRTANIHTTLETMAGEAEMAGRLEDLADIRAAMDELEGLLNGTLAEVAARTDEFSGAALGSQHALVDPNIDTDKLRRWIDEQVLMTHERLPEVDSIVDPAARAKASQDLTLEAAYWVHLRSTLDRGLNPLADSAGQIALMRVERVEPYYAQFADEIAAAAAQGYDLVVPRLPEEDTIELYLQLQNRLLDSLSDPTFHRTFDEMGDDAFTAAVRARIEAGDAFLGPDALRSPPRNRARPRLSMSPSPEPQGTTSAKRSTRSRIGTGSTGMSSTSAATSTCANTSGSSMRRRRRCSPGSAARPMRSPATSSATIRPASTTSCPRWPRRRRRPAT